MGWIRKGFKRGKNKTKGSKLNESQLNICLFINHISIYTLLSCLVKEFTIWIWPEKCSSDLRHNLVSDQIHTRFQSGWDAYFSGSCEQLNTACVVCWQVMFIIDAYLEESKINSIYNWKILPLLCRPMFFLVLPRIPATIAWPNPRPSYGNAIPLVFPIIGKDPIIKFQIM
jgi:hypothetical protein